VPGSHVNAPLPGEVEGLLTVCAISLSINLKRSRRRLAAGAGAAGCRLHFSDARTPTRTLARQAALPALGLGAGPGLGLGQAEVAVGAPHERAHNAVPFVVCRRIFSQDIVGGECAARRHAFYSFFHDVGSRPYAATGGRSHFGRFQALSAISLLRLRMHQTR